MSIFNNKSSNNVTLEHKIAALREAGMNASADRLAFQLKVNGNKSTQKIKPLSPIEMKRKVKEHQNLGQMKV